MNFRLRYVTQRPHTNLKIMVWESLKCNEIDTLAVKNGEICQGYKNTG